jgi:hypothetical protein
MATITRRTPATTRAVNFCLDLDALAILDAMAPGRVGAGRLLSELLRREGERRAARPALLDRLRQQAAAGGATPEDRHA